MTAFRGLTWDRPRRHAPLAAAAALHADAIEITWHTALGAHWGGFSSGKLRTTEAAWVRPRFPGYIELQTLGPELIRDGLDARVPGRRLLDGLHALWRASLPAGAVL